MNGINVMINNVNKQINLQYAGRIIVLFIITSPILVPILALTFESLYDASGVPNHLNINGVNFTEIDNNGICKIPKFCHIYETEFSVNSSDIIIARMDMSNIVYKKGLFTKRQVTPTYATSLENVLNLASKSGVLYYDNTHIFRIEKTKIKQF